MIYWLSFILMNFLSLIFFPTKYLNRENFPQKGGFIIASNHISNIDPFILGISRVRRFAFMAKEELFDSPIKNVWFRGMGAFPVKRKSSDFRAIRETLKNLSSGVPVIVFPEGTRKAKNKEGRIEAGIGLLALKSKVPIVPTYIEGTDKAMPPGSKFFKRHPIKVKFGKPIEFNEKEPYSNIAKRIMSEINALAEK